MSLPFSEHLLGMLISSHLLLIQRGLSTYPFSTFPCHQFSDHVPSKALTIQPNDWPHGQESFYNHSSGHISLQRNGTARCPAVSSAHWEDFPLPLLFRDVPKGPLMLLLSTFRWWLSIVQNHRWSRLAFSSSASRWGFWCMLMNRRRCRRSGDHRHLGYSCMLLIFVFRACSVLTADTPLRIWWWSAVVHSQLWDLVCQLPPSSWWPAKVSWKAGSLWLSVQSPLRPRSRPRGISQKETSYLQWIVRLCDKILCLCCEGRRRLLS